MLDRPFETGAQFALAGTFRCLQSLGVELQTRQKIADVMGQMAGPGTQRGEPRLLVNMRLLPLMKSVDICHGLLTARNFIRRTGQAAPVKANEQLVQRLQNNTSQNNTQDQRQRQQ